MFKATTVLAVNKGGKVAMAGDGQVTMGQTVVKHGARKIRRLYHDQVLAGFAGAVADAFTLFSLFEGKLEEYHGQLVRAAVEMTKAWRTDRMLRRLDALLLVADKDHLLLLSGSRSEEHTSELQSRPHLVCRLLLEKKKIKLQRERCGQGWNPERSARVPF